MTNKEAINLLEKSKVSLTGIKGFSLNKAIVKAEMELEIIKTTLEKMIKVPDDVKEKTGKYNEELEKINNKYCKKKNGKPDLLEETLPDGRKIAKFQFEEKEAEEREKAIESLNKKFKDTFDKITELDKKRIELLEEDSGYKKSDIDDKMIPKDIMIEQMRVLYKMFNINESD